MVRTALNRVQSLTQDVRVINVLDDYKISKVL